MNNGHPYNTALLLVSHPEMAAVDRQLLKNATIRLTSTMFSGVEAAKYLANAYERKLSLPACIFCHEQLSDMSGQTFIALMRLHPAFMSFPIILVATKTKIRPPGCSGVLSRPYTVNDLNGQLLLAAQCQATTENTLKNIERPNHDAFKAELAKHRQKQDDSKKNQEDAYNEANLAFKQGKYDLAIMRAQQCLKINSTYEPAKALLERILAQKALHSRQGHKASPLKDAQASPLKAYIASRDKTVPDLGALQSADELDDEALNAPILMHFGKHKQKILPPLKEPKSIGLFKNYPKIQEAINIARITLTLLRRS